MNENEAVPIQGAASFRTGSPGRTRTSDPAVNSRLLYLLSYRGAERGFVSRADRVLANSEGA